MTLEELKKAIDDIAGTERRLQFRTEALKNPAVTLKIATYRSGDWYYEDIPAAAVAHCIAVVNVEHERELKALAARRATLETSH